MGDLWEVQALMHPTIPEREHGKHLGRLRITWVSTCGAVVEGVLNGKHKAVMGRARLIRLLPW